MNHDDKNPELQTLIEPELEARLVAAVLGEASAFETAELERLIIEKPELGIFKRRIEAVHGLLGVAERPDQAPLRLAPERRAKILQTIGALPAAASATEPKANTPIVFEPKKRSRKWRGKLIWGSGLAASFTLAAIMAFQYGEPLPKRPIRPEPSLTVLGPTVQMPQMVAGDAEAQPERPEIQNEPIVLSPFKVASPRPSLMEKRAVESGRIAPQSQLSFGGAAGRASAGIDERKVAFERKLESTAKARAEEIAVARAEEDRAAKTRAVRPQNLSWGVNEKAKDTLAKEFAPAAAAPSIATFDKAPAEAITLSPFQVSSSRDRGYAAGNTLSGSRLNTNLQDLGARITVVTKQSLTDNASLDVNARFDDDSFLSGTKLGIAAAAVGQDAKKSDFAASPAQVDELLSQEKAVAAAGKPAPAPADAPQGEINAAKEPVSTFSLHVSDVSFRLAQAALARGETPDPTRIRPEEFYNAFDYGDPAPTAADKISCRIEQAAHPLVQQRNLVRIAMKVPATGRGAGQPLHLTVLLDTSGSMERADRILSVRRALEVLGSLLGPNDRVTLIGFARQPRLLAEELPGNEAAKLTELAAHTPFTGGTNLEEALKLSGELARRHRNAAAQNRIVLLTDGAANLGNADPAELAKTIETLRQQGIAFDACGVGTDGLDDSILEALTRKGDGRYYVIDKPEDADSGFARQLAGAFRPAAENVKVQVRFNPARVGSYRLIGFEQHRLREEDFRNDQVDAAELAAEEAAVAVYQVEVLPQGEGELGEVFVRFRDAATANMVERSWTIAHEPRARTFDRSTPTMQLAGTAALLAEKLRGGPAANLIRLDELTATVNGLRGHYANQARVQELVGMFEQMRRHEGK